MRAPCSFVILVLFSSVITFIVPVTLCDERLQLLRLRLNLLVHSYPPPA